MAILSRDEVDGSEVILFGCDECGEAINPVAVNVTVKTTTTYVSKFGKVTKENLQRRQVIFSYPSNWLIGFFDKVAHEECGLMANRGLPSIGEFQKSLSQVDARVLGGASQ